MNWYSRRPIIVVTSPRLSEVEMNAALALSKDSPIFKTLLQLLGDFCEDAVRGAVNSVGDNKATAYIGGWEHLDSFREELLRRREEGLKASQP